MNNPFTSQPDEQQREEAYRTGRERGAQVAQGHCRIGASPFRGALAEVWYQGVQDAKDGAPVLPAALVCDMCERPTRPQGVTIEERPGTVAYAAKGLCHTCYRHAGKTGGAA